MRPTVTLLFLGSQMTACTSWTTQSVSPEEFFARNAPYQVRVTRADSTHVVLVHPRLARDSVTGELPDSTQAQQAVPLADIRSIAVRRKDATRTTLFVVGLGVAAAPPGIHNFRSAPPAGGPPYFELPGRL
jgi:hypothetical protein